MAKKITEKERLEALKIRVESKIFQLKEELGAINLKLKKYCKHKYSNIEFSSYGGVFGTCSKCGLRKELENGEI